MVTLSMSRKKPDPDAALASDDTFEVAPTSDEARLPPRGTFKPERPRDGTAESSDLHDLAQRAAESADDLEAPLDFEPAARDTPRGNGRGKRRRRSAKDVNRGK